MKTQPQVVLRDGRPSAVILDLERYRELLERAEEMEDLRVLRAMSRRPLRFRPLGEFLKKHRAGARRRR